MAGDRRRQRDYDGDYFVDGGLLFSVSSLAASNIVPAAASHGWAKCQKPTRNEIKKNREIYSLYLCMQQFYKFWISRPFNDRKHKLCESAETYSEKLVKFTRCTYACNSFTNFVYQDHAMTGNGNYVCESAETCLIKLMKTHGVSLFSASFFAVRQPP